MILHLNKKPESKPGLYPDLKSYCRVDKTPFHLVLQLVFLKIKICKYCQQI